MGTAKYPSESEYSQFIRDNGGTLNAYTASDHTVYGFSVTKDAFEGALDRFSQFFISPLFNESCVERELHAVDQEFRKNVEDDHWREHHVMKEIADPNHPYSFFNTGHLESMSKLKQETLKEWYKHYYKGQLMRLILYSNTPLDQMQQYVLDKFSSIQKSSTKDINIPFPIFPPSSFKHWIMIEPIKEIRKLTLMWEIPEEFCKSDSKVADMLSHGNFYSFNVHFFFIIEFLLISKN